MAELLQFFGILLPGFVQNSTQHHCRVHLAFSPNISLKFKWCSHTTVLIRLQLVLYNLVISITTVLQIHIQAKTNTQAGLRC